MNRNRAPARQNMSHQDPVYDVREEAGDIVVYEQFRDAQGRLYDHREIMRAEVSDVLGHSIYQQDSRFNLPAALEKGSGVTMEGIRENLSGSNEATFLGAKPTEKIETDTVVENRP